MKKWLPFWLCLLALLPAAHAAVEGELLPPEQAYRFSASVKNADTVLATWKIADGYYLYRNKFQFKTDTPGVRLGSPKFPSGTIHHDEFFGNQEVYRHQVTIEIPVQRATNAPNTLHLTVVSQGCADAGVCYPPQTRTIALQLPAAGSASTAPGATAAATPAPPAQSRAPVSEQDRLTRLLAGHHLPLTLLTFYGLGLLLTFTPCVFPMIPILSSIIAGQGGQGLSTRRAFVLSLVYVLAMAVAYTAAGVIAALLGKNLQAAFQDPWVLGTFSAVFVLLAISMFGFYELRLPSFLHTKLTEVSNRQRGGSIAGVAVMGLLSALIVSPCVTAPLVGALVYISQTRDAVLGGLALFALSMGMGTPLLVIGTTEGKFLPKAGPWMDTIKAIFGVVMLAVAIWLLQSVLPTEILILLWAGLLIVSAVYMGALEPLKAGVSGWRKLWKGLGVVMMIYSALLLIGVAGGSKSVLQPLQGIGFTPTGTTAADGPAAPRALPFQHIKGLAGLDAALAQAKAQGKPVMLDFYADWCVSCKELQQGAFRDPTVIAALANTRLLEADVTANDAADQALLRHFGIYGPPSVMFFDAHGQELKDQRVVGYMDAQDFAARVR
ncbi:MAG: protein-disulfide reductase DsbD, partial [Gammaproteobacteria bacterium]|nr:protein-disulfide reductase DsbD [Gammaproteobacteria bacterium]